MKSKTYNGLDLLKFIMALFVVMIRVKPNVHSEILTTIFNPILNIAVPVFFFCSFECVGIQEVNKCKWGDCPKTY